MSVLDKAVFLAAAAKPLPVTPVDVPELGGTVYVKEMSGIERDAWERAQVSVRGKGRNITFDPNLDNIRARLLVRCLCNEQGERLFTDADAGEVGKLPASIVVALYDAAQVICGLSQKDLEELGNASAPAAGSDSPTN